MSTTQEQSTAVEQAGMVVDARGRRVSQLDPVVLALTHQTSAVSADVLQSIAAQVRRGVDRAARVGMWLSIVCFASLVFVLVVQVAALMSGKIDKSELLRVMIPFAGAWVAPLAIWVGARTARHRKITRIMLAHQRCPHCGYDLRLLPRAESDGATVCPECGCAWVMEAGDRGEGAQ